MTQRSSSAAIREIRASVLAWAERYRNTPDPTSPPVNGFTSLSLAMQRADYAIQNVSEKEEQSEEWKSAIAEYRQTLRDVRELLADYEVRLRLRRSQMTRLGSRLASLRSWADLARFVG